MTPTVWDALKPTPMETPSTTSSSNPFGVEVTTTTGVNLNSLKNQGSLCLFSNNTSDNPMMTGTLMSPATPEPPMI